ncbi:MAG: N-acetyl-gamma-glutamyl-phosphate reductase [Solirubrobacterales bacterium]
MNEAATHAQAQPLAAARPAPVLVAGATGYTGALAARLVWEHPSLELVAATSRSEAGKRLDEVDPARGVPIELSAPDLRALDGVEAAIVALPHGAAAHLAAELHERGVKVVDLSADLRLRDLATYERWYGAHDAPHLIGEAVYGMTELDRDRIAEATLVANPGCYPTAALLALAPLARAGLCAEVVIDAKSGYSGAGRGAVDPDRITHDFRPYGTAGHRHGPEIEQELAAMGARGPASFVPHLLPVEQGLLASCYVTPTRPIEPAELVDLYAGAYAEEPFVDVTDVPPGVGDVRETNRADVHVSLDAGSGRVLVFCAIDNLWKGASGQAVQNLNLMLGLDETQGLG